MINVKFLDNESMFYNTNTNINKKKMFLRLLGQRGPQTTAKG